MQIEQWQWNPICTCCSSELLNAHFLVSWERAFTIIKCSWRKSLETKGKGWATCSHRKKWQFGLSLCISSIHEQITSLIRSCVEAIWCKWHNLPLGKREHGKGRAGLGVVRAAPVLPGGDTWGGSCCSAGELPGTGSSPQPGSYFWVSIYLPILLYLHSGSTAFSCFWQMKTT